MTNHVDLGYLLNFVLTELICSDLHHTETEQDKVINASLKGLDLNSEASIPCGTMGMDHNTDSFGPAFLSHQNKMFSCREMVYSVCKEDKMKTLFSLPYMFTDSFHYFALLLLWSTNCGLSSKN